MATVASSGHLSYEEFLDGRNELQAQHEAGELDRGHDDEHGFERYLEDFSCLNLVLVQLGVQFDGYVSSVSRIPEAVCKEACSCGAGLVVKWRVCDDHNLMNHVEIADLASATVRGSIVPAWVENVDGLECKVGYATIAEFFSKAASSWYLGKEFYVNVPGLAERVKVQEQANAAVAQGLQGSCLSRLVETAGYKISSGVTRVVDIPGDISTALRAHRDMFKVAYKHYGVDDPRNHAWAVVHSARSGRLETTSVSLAGEPIETCVYAVTNFDNFFNVSSTNAVANYRFYADQSTFAGDTEAGDEFGADVPLPPGPAAARAASRGQPAASYHAPREEPRHYVPSGPGYADSVVDDSLGHGASNVSGGVARPKRRVIKSKAVSRTEAVVKKTYAPAKNILFNNLDEMYQDAISRDYAQDILEEVFRLWGIPFDDSEATKYAEDLVFAFIIATTASNKADYNREFAVPVGSSEEGEVVVNMQTLSDVIISNHSLTRRRFAKGVSDDMRRYLADPVNSQLLPVLANRAGCDPQYATLAFDGSTNCSSMTSVQARFTRMLEGRNLFEDESVLAQGASDRLMAGVHTGVRSKVER